MRHAQNDAQGSGHDTAPSIQATSRSPEKGLRSQAAGLIANLSAGALVAFLSANFSLSYAALLFAGAPPGTQAQGLAMLLISSMVLAIVGARLSYLPFAILFTDGTLVALLASVTAGIVSDMHDAPAAAIGATLVTTLTLATLVTGLGLWLIGLVRGGSVVRYIPFQVMAGVLAASGWSLSAGGAAVAIGHPVNFALAADPAALLRLLLAIATAFVLLTASSRFRSALALPAVIVATIALYHTATTLAGWSIPEQRQAGWLLDLPPGLAFAMPWFPSTLAAVDWSVMANHATGLFALIPVTAICLLLGLSGIETVTGLDVAVDRDVRANGIASFVAGALGGVLGITSISRTLLVFRLGVRGRGAGLAAGLMGGVLPLLLPGLLGGVPRFVMGGLLLFSGLGMLRQWVLQSRRQMNWAEWLTVLAVLAIAVRFGLIVAAFAGLLLGCATFAIIYSRGSPIRARYRGNAAQSHIDRSDPELALLAEHADALLVLHLQGFVFFGTARRVLDEIQREIAKRPGTLRHLVLEFSNVQGIDSSALASFERLQRLAASEHIVLAFAALPAPVAARLSGLSVHLANTLDEALEWREAALLADFALASVPTLASILGAEFDHPADAAAFLDLLEPAEFAAGEVMMRQGEHSSDLLFIEHGRASVTVQFNNAPAIRVRTFGVGTMAGEIGFYLGLSRTATVAADEPCRALRLTQSAMRRLETEQPAAALAFQRSLLRRLSNRLLDKDKLVSALLLERGN